MTLDLDELERLARESTPGPWLAQSVSPTDGVFSDSVFVLEENECGLGLPVEVCATYEPADAAFIAAARDAVPTLCARIRELEAGVLATLDSLRELEREHNAEVAGLRARVAELETENAKLRGDPCGACGGEGCPRCDNTGQERAAQLRQRIADAECARRRP